MKQSKERKEVFDYSYGGSEDPVGKAVLANMRGKYSKPEKPKVTLWISVRFTYLLAVFRILLSCSCTM